MSQPSSDEVPKHHDLSRLLQSLKAGLQSIGYEKPPTDFDKAIRAVKDIEKGDHTRLRYPLVGKPLISAFVKTETIRVVQLQESLAQLFNTQLYFDVEAPPDDPAQTFAGGLAWDCRASLDRYYLAGGLG